MTTFKAAKNIEECGCFTVTKKRCPILGILQLFIIIKFVMGNLPVYNYGVQSAYQEAIKFATIKHQEKRQKVKGTKLPYVVHLSNVAMEILMAAPITKDFNLVYAIQVALLHDTLEDTETTLDELRDRFGENIAVAVLALTKDDNLAKDKQITDSLSRIKKLQVEVWAVKLADRITNLQPPPANWSWEKNIRYLRDSQIILDELKESNQYLANRLEVKISEASKRLK